ncbi:MAG: trypsin-like peptidase domain-containing protein [Bacteroidota bacterium]
MKMKNVGRAIVIVLPLLVGGMVGYNMGHSVADPGTTPTISASGTRPFVEGKTVGYLVSDRDSVVDVLQASRRNAITRAVAAASPAVVGINVIEVRQYRERSPWGDDPFFRYFFGDRVYSQPVHGLGSGFLISPDGYILTNDHVAGNAKEITVTLTSGDECRAELVGSDQISDVALLKISGEDLPHLTMGNSEDVLIGEWVIALGNPFGLFDVADKPTVTVGVVSATGMNLRAQEGRAYRGMIQTDAAINSGNSGGPLMNSLGEVIGVNAVIYTPNQGSIGLGFAIPINRVKTVVAELKRSGKIDREYWTGLEFQAVDRRIARYFGLTRVEGVIVSDVKGGSPAAEAGFEVGDIILEANGEKVDDVYSLVAILDEARTGDLIRFQVFRDRKRVEKSLRLERRTI